MTGRRMSHAPLMSAILLLLSTNAAWALEHTHAEEPIELMDFDPRKPAKDAPRDGKDKRSLTLAGVTAGCG